MFEYIYVYVCVSIYIYKYMCVCIAILDGWPLCWSRSLDCLAMLVSEVHHFGAKSGAVLFLIRMRRIWWGHVSRNQLYHRGPVICCGCSVRLGSICCTLPCSKSYDLQGTSSAPTLIGHAAYAQRSRFNYKHVTALATDDSIKTVLVSVYSDLASFDSLPSVGCFGVRLSLLNLVYSEK